MAEKIDVPVLPAPKQLSKARATAYAEIRQKMNDLRERLQPHTTGTIPPAATWRDNIEGAQDENIAAEEALLAGKATDVVRNIQAAQARMRDGTYGLCLGCGIEIPLARLRELPTTPVCVTCAQEAEDEGTDWDTHPTDRTFAIIGEMEEAQQEEAVTPDDPDAEVEAELPSRGKVGRPRKS